MRRPAVCPEDDGLVTLISPTADKYLSAHGYNITAVHHIEHALSSSRDLQEFLGYFHPRGMAWTEIVYLWELIQADVE